MITAADVLRRESHLVPRAENGAPLHDHAAETLRKIEFWVERANLMPDSRFKSAQDANPARVLFVLHQITKPPLDLSKAPLPRAAKTAAWRHPWSGTKFGEQLQKAVRTKF